ncbi:hypothetical protein LMG23994_02489 [Cupriavidus pinatubonensis]|uniref:Uncharacterized protein n=1 Tax=Cupriavidus pinatubonensis TaxID=248026 RepID=A0ABM8WYW5_9BURK|nr:hypothetical protein LMG23994_02489 [Cupriavidus pinatubonensis]
MKHVATLSLMLALAAAPAAFAATPMRGGFACSDRDPEFLSGSAGAVRLPI